MWHPYKLNSNRRHPSCMSLSKWLIIQVPSGCPYIISVWINLDLHRMRITEAIVGPSVGVATQYIIYAKYFRWRARGDVGGASAIRRVIAPASKFASRVAHIAPQRHRGAPPQPCKLPVGWKRCAPVVNGIDRIGPATRRFRMEYLCAL